ncbi:ABC transporter substrate-binding protein [Symbiobacterium thermophilum]|uniref:ABC transporter substrate-binding protein n=1 Tax=Symbiobacterium thermophilum TaxID=2734 RepID=UPI0035C66616
MNLRQRAAVALLSLCALVLSACGGSQQPPSNQPPSGGGQQQQQQEPQGSAEPKEIVVYTSHQADIHEPLFKAFEEATGIKVTPVYAATGELFQRMRAEANNPLGDVIFGGGAETHEANKDLLQPYVPKEIDMLAPGTVAKDNSWTGFTALPIVIMYNTNLLTADEAPKSFADLTDPKWAGKIAMPDAAKSGSAYTTVVTILHAMGRDDGKGWEVMKQIAANAKILASSSQGPKGTNDGEYAVSLTHEEAAFKYVAAGGPVGIVYPAEGTSNVPDAVAIIKGAKHPENAKAFIDFMVSQQMQEYVAKELNRRPVRTDVAPPEGLEDVSKIKFLDYDMDWAANQREAVLDQWKDIVVQ